MFTPGTLSQVYIAPGVTDMRKSIDGLADLISGQLDLNPLTGNLFCFCNRKRDIIKILYWDRNGFCLWHKRLEQDRFQWPKTEAEVLSVHGYQLSWLLDGLSLEQHKAYRHLSFEHS